MKVLIAPNAFKESLSAVEAAQAIERGFKVIFPKAAYVLLPIADGGDGTLDAFVVGANARLINCKVTDPRGAKIDSQYALLPDGSTAIIEMAKASGLKLVPLEKRNPMNTTSYGTGELIKHALDKGIRRFVIGIGGSATNDGGMGAFEALGIKFLKSDGTAVARGGMGLLELADIDISGVHSAAKDAEFIVACDVDNPLFGPQGAAHTYAKQKGASANEITELDRGLQNFSNVVTKKLGVDIGAMPGAGAAGGIGAGLVACLGAKLKPGFEIVADVSKLKEHLKDSTLVLSGEGEINYQSVHGKAPVALARLAQTRNLPVIVFAGNLAHDYELVYKEGVSAVVSIVPGARELQQCLDNAAQYLEDAARRTAELLRIGGLL